MAGFRQKITIAERRQTHCLDARTQAACGTRHGESGLRRPPLAGALACRHSTYGSRQRDFRPEGSASGQASRGQRQSADIAANAIVGHSDAPRAPVLLLAGMMPEPPGCGLYLSARGRRTRSASREYPPQRRPLMSEIGGVYGHRFRQVKGVGILLDESAHFARHDSLRACGTRMILWRHGIRHWRPWLVPISPRFIRTALAICATA